MTTETAKNFTPLQHAFLALEKTQAKLDALKRAQTEPIAIVGMACRMPGGANTPEEFWQLLRSGRDTITEVPPDRWDLGKFYDANPQAPGKANTKFGAFIRNLREFDADFFEISPREVVMMDPQHRLLLETSWEALENACIPPDSLSRSQTGVFIGISGFEYCTKMISSPYVCVDAYVNSGNSHSTAAGRLAYFFGFQGPCVALDTACSSSLVAVHLACQSLRAGESHVALAGGVNALFDPMTTVGFSKARMLAADGRCKTFDDAADGYVRGEGVGMIVLKRMSDAVSAGDPILAVIRGSCVNQDGPSGGLTVPNGPAQTAVIRQALASANVVPDQVTYVEAHGTGTQLGDPIELGALESVFGSERAKPLHLGSVKTNIGHLESAAGIASLIKVVLMMQHAQIAPHLHFKRPNSRARWSSAMRVPTQLTPWQPESGTRIAGISSFGFSGTNSHVILEQAPNSGRRTPVANESPKPARQASNPVVVTAHSRHASSPLEAGIEAIDRVQRLRPNGNISLPTALPLPIPGLPFPVTPNMLTGDSPKSHTPAESNGHRHAHQRDEQGTRGASGNTSSTPELFLRDYVLPVSAKTPAGLNEACTRLARAIEGNPSLTLAEISRSLFVGRAHFDHRAAIVARSLPAAVMGLNDAARPGSHSNVYRVPFQAGKTVRCIWLFSGDPRDTAPLVTDLRRNEPAFSANFDVCDRWWKEHHHQSLVDVAQQSRSFVSTEARAVDWTLHFAAQFALAEMWKELSCEPAVVHANGVGCVAALCSLGTLSMEEGLQITACLGALSATRPESQAWKQKVDQLATLLSQISFSEPAVPTFWGVEGDIRQRFNDAQWWLSHVGTNGLRHQQNVEWLQNLNCELALELGSESLEFARLTAAAGPSLTWLNCQPAMDSPAETAATSATGLARTKAILYATGAMQRPTQAKFAQGLRPVHLPTYPFQRRAYWEEGMEQATNRIHPLIASQLREHNAVTGFAFDFQGETADYLQDHRIGERAFLPASAYLELALAAAHAVQDNSAKKSITLSDVRFVRPFALDRASGLSLRASIKRDGSRFDLDFVSQAGQGDHSGHNSTDSPQPPNNLHASVKLMQTSGSETADSAAWTDKTRGDEKSGADLASRFQSSGVNYGERFRPVRRTWVDQSQVICEVKLHESLVQNAADYYIHPVLLDGCLQALAALSAAPADSSSERNALQSHDTEANFYLPVAVDEVTYFAPAGAHLLAQLTIRPSHPLELARVTADIEIAMPDGRMVAVLRGVAFQQVSRQMLTSPEAAVGGAVASSLAEAALSPEQTELLARVRQATPEAQAEMLIDFLRQRLLHVLRKPSTDVIDPEQSLFHLGMDSLMSVEFVYEINRGLGIRLPPESLVTYSTLASLAAALPNLLTAVAESSGPAASGPQSKWIAHCQPRPAADVRLFCFHHLGGSAESFAHWSASIDPRIEVCPIQLPGREGRAEEQPCTKFNKLVEDLASELLELADRQFVLLGHSAGCLLAYELAVRMKRQFNLQPQALILGSLWHPELAAQKIAASGADEVGLIRQLGLHAGMVDGGGDQGAVSVEAVRAELAPYVRGDLDLFGSYRYQVRQPLDCPIAVILGRDDPLVRRNEVLEWSKTTSGDFRLHQVAGAHGNWLLQPQLVSRILSDLNT